MQPYPRSPDLVWPGQLHGTGCLSARALDTGFPTVVWCLCLGPGCGWVWVSVTLPVLAGVSGGCVRVWCVVSSLFCRLGLVVFAVGLGFWPAPHLSLSGVWDVRGCVHALPAARCSRFRCAVWACVLGPGFGLRPATPWEGVGVCVCSCARPAWSPAPSGCECCAGVCGWCCALPLLAGASGCVRVCARAPLVPRLSWLGCAVWACVLGPGLGCAPPFLVGLSGCVCFFLRGVPCFCFVVSVAGCPCGPSPAPAVGSGCVSPGWGLLVVVCPPPAPFVCPPPSFSLPRPLGRCSPGALPGPTRLWWVGGGRVLDAGSGPFPWCFPFGGPMLALPVRV